MPLAYWCVLIAALMPLAIVSYAKAGTQNCNHNPREGIDDLPPAKRRAYAAHQNAYENFPFFAAAVIIAVVSGTPINTVNILAALYIVLRAMHAVLYVNDAATARSIVYALALVANIAIFVLPAFQ